MKELKFVLWICAIGCLLGFVVAVLPWFWVRTVLEWFGIYGPYPEDITVYVLRVFAITSGLIGIFFVILARDPLKYGPMLSLAACGLVLLGLACIFFGFRYTMPPLAFGSDAAFCIVTGTLLLIFRHKALQPAAA